jgi:hypothetical protein
MKSLTVVAIFASVVTIGKKSGAARLVPNRQRGWRRIAWMRGAGKNYRQTVISSSCVRSRSVAAQVRFLREAAAFRVAVARNVNLEKDHVA